MTNSGLLSILNDCLFFLSDYAKDKDIRIVALVHSKSMFSYDGIEYLEFPKSKKSWFFRLYYEYFYFRKLSLQLQPDVWFSLHDISPRVVAKKKFVYCHNPTPFFKPQLKDWQYGFKVSLFSVFYKHLYGLNIKSNTAVIVQQHWINNAFKHLYGISNVVTAYPQIPTETTTSKVTLDPNKTHFFYPAFPRTFKNFEAICEAVQLLPKTTRDQIQVHLTLEKAANAYANAIVEKYGHLEEICFLGLLNRPMVSAYYKACDVLLFPSRLETWGLPLTECQTYHKTIFAADLPYAHETLAGYDKAHFFNPLDPQELAVLIEKQLSNQLPKPTPTAVLPPDFHTWNALFDFIFKGINR